MVLFALFSVVVMMAGCFESEATKIDGKIYNNLDEKINVFIKQKSTGREERYSVHNESSRSCSLNPGTYTVTAKYFSSNEFIDSTDFIIEATDDHFIITVNTTVYANAY